MLDWASQKTPLSLFSTRQNCCFNKRNITVSHILNSWDLLLLAFDLTAKSTGKIASIFRSVFVFCFPFLETRLFTLLFGYSKEDRNNTEKKSLKLVFI